MGGELLKEAISEADVLKLQVSERNGTADQLCVDAEQLEHAATIAQEHAAHLLNVSSQGHDRGRNTGGGFLKAEVPLSISVLDVPAYLIELC